MKRFEMAKMAKEYQEIKGQIKALEEQKADLETEIKAEMDKRKIEEITVGSSVIRYQVINSCRFDSKRFREENENLYDMYKINTASRRFTVASVAEPNG